MSSLKQIQALNAKINYAGKQAVVTGGTSGIGKGIALALAKANVSVTILGRNKQRGTEIVAEMQKLSPEGKFSFEPVDAFLVSASQKFVKQFEGSHDRLDFLVLSSGMATTQGFTPTPEGIDEKLSIHYFNRIALAQEFMPLLTKTAKDSDVRVLSILSGGVHSPFAYKEDFDLKKTYSVKNAANAAGYYNDLGFDSLAQENKDVSFIHAAPGFVNTNWGTEFPTLLRWGVRLLQPLGRSIADCGEFMVRGLFADEYKTGFHCMGSNGQKANTTNAHTEDARKDVWARTKEVIKKALGEEKKEE